MSRPNNGWVYHDRIGQQNAGLTALHFYAGRYTHSPRALWQKHFANGRIRLDDRPINTDFILQAGQQLAYHRPPWIEAEVPLHLAILHRDRDLLALVKPAGLPVLPGGNFLDHTLLHILHQRYPERPAPLHRLGRGTSGLVLCARTGIARQRLSQDWAQQRLKKFYRALVQGTTMADTFDLNTPIGRVPHPQLGYLYAAHPQGKAALSHCRVLKRRPDLDQTLLEVEIPTGRPHQIRIHLASAGFPLVGEPLYGTGGQATLSWTASGQDARERPVLPGDGGYHLHACRIIFDHPRSGAQTSLNCRPPRPLQLDY
ncbi:MAG: RNA pseudouridine synthase [Candidatus Latescibacteria bacterium]|nr:RNA pseudouridine synthase [Candidatus Latescibacterota bacterium]